MFALIFFLAVGNWALGQPKPLTAFQAVELAKREVNDEARNKLVQIFGPRSSVGLMPVEWHVLFFDPYAQQNGTMVRVAGNTIIAIQEGYTQMNRMRLASYKLEEIIEPRTLKLDSSAVLQALQRSTPLKNVKLTSVEMWLRKEDKAPGAPGIWQVTLFAESAPDRQGKTREVEIGKARVSAETGQILNLNLNLRRL
ncbi:MAG: hypothetical protein SNJ84_04205 [Verrucomicrobiia bacterium]